MRKTIGHLFSRKLGIISLLAALFAAMSMTVSAQCGGSFNAMATAAGQKQSVLLQPSPVHDVFNAVSDDERPSIVGLWHIRFVVGSDTIQEAFQVWNLGGTEVHNPNVDPRGGSVCLGAWKESVRRAFRLTHRVWNYNSTGTFMGTINLSETVTVGSGGATQSGTFTLDFYDPAGNFLFEVPGNVVGERISPE